MIECIIWSKFIKFTEYHNHVDNCEGDGEVVEDEDKIEDNNENNKDEDKDMN